MFAWKRSNSRSSKDERIQQLEQDADIAAEAQALSKATIEDAHPTSAPTPTPAPTKLIPLNVINQTHCSSTETARLVEAAGGLPMLRRFTELFYEKAFADPHLDNFIRDHNDPHGERFATWIAEKMGLGRPWSAERATRQCPFHLGDGMGTIMVHDRSSAHFAAWHSPKRDPHEWGQHFKLDDCRLWMRLHFWAARESGAFDHPGFADYYVRYIGHFVSVYERTAPPFARESMRWSADPANIQAYLDAGRRMPEIMGLSTREALQQLPEDEREYYGSASGRKCWPYELRR